MAFNFLTHKMGRNVPCPCVSGKNIRNAAWTKRSDSGQSIKKVLTKNVNYNKNNALASNTGSFRRVNRVVLLQLRPLWCRCL
jgi:hypothetical protein